MLVIGIAVAVTGAVVFLAGLVRILQANPSNRVPFFAEAPVPPRRTHLLRALGAALVVLGTGLISTASIVLVAVVLSVWLAAPIAMIAVHNARVSRPGV
jgi:hypothetical protein